MKWDFMISSGKAVLATREPEETGSVVLRLINFVDRYLDVVDEQIL